jgi:uncharacterized membrane protein HdeD (DUF308 family)
MTTTIESTESRPAEATGRIGKHWGWMLAFGILTIAAGICALAWPGITLLAAAIVFGLQLIVAGIYRLVAAFAALEESTRTRVMLGVLSLIIGLYAVRHVLLALPGLSLVVMVFLIGAWLIFFGVLQTALALRLRSATHSGWQLGRDAGWSHVTTPRVPRGAM